MALWLVPSSAFNAVEIATAYSAPLLTLLNGKFVPIFCTIFPSELL
jgi:hypothetical protein